MRACRPDGAATLAAMQSSTQNQALTKNQALTQSEAPPQSQASRQQKRYFWMAMAAFLVPVVAMTFFSWQIFGKVRADATLTDARLRELAWSVLAYADRHDSFPTAEAQLRAFVAMPEGVPSTLTHRAAAGAKRSYPATRAEVTSAIPAPSLDESLESIEIEWGIAGDVQPILRSKGKATLNGTSPAIGEWLYAMAERIRGGS